MSASTPILKVDSLTAGYQSAAVIRDLEFDVRAGEIVSLLGANGAGKTTTLRVISGLVKPMQGGVLLDGDDLAELSATARAQLGMSHVPEGRGIFFGLTVAEHFRCRYPGEVVDEDLAYDLFPALRDIRNRRAGLLSGGEQQMLAVGRTLARHPKLLLLDELSLGLAPNIVARLLPIVRDFAKDSGCAVLLVEQHIRLALEIADRGLVLSHGQIVASATAEDLRANRELLVGSYLGGVAEPG